MHKEILKLAAPSILANITIPLVGLVDLAIAGHISNASTIGGIAVGTMLFDLLYWTLGFLRVGTGGMTAQAFGRGDRQGIADIFSQSILLAVASSLVIWLIGWPFVDLVMWLMPHSAEVDTFARQYFSVRIWAAPATLSLMVFRGWFIGNQNTVSPMVCDIVVNGVNMAASYWLAVRTPMGAIGVAYGTVIAQYTGLFTAAVLLCLRYKNILPLLRFRAAFKWRRIRELLLLNGNLILRSLGFMVIYVGFTVITSYYGDTDLAVGAIMMKIFMVFSFFLDGFAYAGEAMVGKYIGARDRKNVDRAVRLLFIWTFGVGLSFTLVYLWGGEGMIRIMTSDTAVIAASRPFLFWLWVMPIVSGAAFMWDGIFIGATAGVQIRNCMLLSAAGFVAVYIGLRAGIGVQAVYTAYFAHLLIRAVYLTLRWGKVVAVKL